MNRIVRRQHGMITRKQARGAGLSDHQINRLIVIGEWVVVHRGVYRHAATRSTYRGRVRAATLATEGVASGLCAASLLGLAVARRPAVEVTLPAHRRTPQIRGVLVRRTSQWSGIDRTVVHGIPVTGVNRCIIDCAAVVSLDALERIAESAIRQQMTNWPALATMLSEQGCQGRKGTAGLRRLLERRLGDPVVPASDFSRRVQHLLRDAGLPEPVLEYRIVEGDGTHLLLADLAWPSLQCAVELDGLANHFDRVDRERDIRVRAEVRASGWRLLELGWELFSNDPDQVIDLIRRLLLSARAQL